jgi:hypothetical protein
MDSINSSHIMSSVHGGEGVIDGKGGLTIDTNKINGKLKSRQIVEFKLQTSKTDKSPFYDSIKSSVPPSPRYDEELQN